MDTSRLSPEIWYLIFQALPSRNDIRNVCAVSKSFGSLAAPLLYRSITFRDSSPTGQKWYKLPDSEDIKDHEKVHGISFGLFWRLLDDRYESLRPFVHDITIECCPSEDSNNSKDHNMQVVADRFINLLDKLPALKTLYFESYPRMTNSFVHALLDHPNTPKVYLLKGRGRIEPKGELPFVRGLGIEADLTATSRHPRESFKPRILELRKIFSTYPNLEHLSVALHRLRSGCFSRFGPYMTLMEPLSLSSEEEFPPLRSLSLSGYEMERDEIVVWKEKAPWHTLESLSLGPQSSEVFLELATGFVQNLKHFKITAYSWADNPNKAQLDAFLSSFDTLESLTVKGRIPSSCAVANHRDLQYLCLHTIENGSGERETLSVEDIQRLDRQCQKLQTLKIDINPRGGWPDDFIQSVATGFKNLRQLYIHVALLVAYAELFPPYEEPDSDGDDNAPDNNDDDNDDGDSQLNRMEAICESTLTESTVKDFSKRFLNHRGPSLLERIQLKTGEHLRWFPQWRPLYSRLENTYARKFRIHPQQNQLPRIEERQVNATFMRGFMEHEVRARWHPSRMQIGRGPRIQG